MSLWPDVVDKEEQAKRLAHCEACDRIKLGLCMECKCFVKVKTHIKVESCPLKKW